MSMYEASAGSLSLVAAGDALVSRRLQGYREPQYLKLRDVVRTADVGLINLEMLLHDFSVGGGPARGETFLGAPPAVLSDLQWFGWNLFSAANNHSIDFGEAGLLSTLDHLGRAGAVAAGAGRHLAEARAPRYLDLPAGRVALLALTTTAPDHAQAQPQGEDLPGRPGISMLRHRVTYHLPGPMLDQLKAISSALGLEAAKEHRPRAGAGIAFEWVHSGSVTSFTANRMPLPGGIPGFDFLCGNFVEGPVPRQESTPHPGDLDDILRWVREARRQADWVLVSVHCHEYHQRMETPPEFLVTFCKAAVAAGADAVIGHGPHLLRGLELYQGKPIFYSLGNFAFQNATVSRQPAQQYAYYGLDRASTPADYFDRRKSVRNTDHLSKTGSAQYESLIPRLRFSGGNLAEITLYPITLGAEAPRPQRGRPLLAEAAAGDAILAHFAELSRPFGTSVSFENGLGRVRL